MTVKQKILFTLKSLFAVVVLLVVVLIIHIALAKPIKYDNAHLQLSRIDFKQPIDVDLAKAIRQHIKSIPGVKNIRLNPDTGVLVYFYDNTVTNSEVVLAQLLQKGNYRAERFVVSPELAQQSACPVLEEDSFSYKFSRGVQRLFSNN